MKIKFQPFWNTPGEDGGGGGADDAAAAAAAAAAGDQDAGGGTPKWFEDKRLTGHSEMLTSMGLTVEDPIDAVLRLSDMEVAAKRKLGKSADELMDRPAKDQALSEWRTANAEVLGVPDKPDAYEIKQPDDWPQDAKWDTAFEDKFRTKAHELGVSGDQVQGLSDLYAEHVKDLLADASTDLAQANVEMMGNLEQDWGDSTPARIARAQQAASVVAEQAKMSPEDVGNVAAILKPKVGDAGVIRLFDAIAGMMADDKAIDIGKGGATGLAMTPAEARAELAQLQGPDGEYSKAVKNRDRAEIQRLQPKIEALTKIVAG